MRSYYRPSLTISCYLIAGVIFGLYGGRVCPMLATLSFWQVFSHSAVVFALLLLTRHFISTGPFAQRVKSAIVLDTGLFFLFSLPFAAFYALNYTFPIDSNAKVIFGMSLFGFLTGLILELDKRLAEVKHIQQGGRALSIDSAEQRQSIVKQAVVLVVFLIAALTASLTLVAVKDVFWLKHNPEHLVGYSGTISVIKEFVFIGMVVAGYSSYILYQWSQLMKAVLNGHESALRHIATGKMDSRVPIYFNDELGQVASLTNTMLDALEHSHQEIQSTRDATIISLSALAESRDNETGAHILRTQEYVRVLAKNLAKHPKYQTKLTEDYIDLLYKSAPLHDVGKVGIPDEILLKPGKLTDQEFAVMKTHAQIGADTLAIAQQRLGECSFLDLAGEIALTHHEKWDGSGYPNQLSGETIPLSGRLMALADVYDALTSQRVYKPAFSHDKAKAIIVEGRNQHFDPEVVDAFLQVEEAFVAIAQSHQ